MNRYTELEKQAQKFLDETDTMQFSTVELLTMFYEHQKQLTLTDVGGSFSQNDMENFAAKCMILGSGGKDTKELLKDFCDNDR